MEDWPGYYELLPKRLLMFGSGGGGGTTTSNETGQTQKWAEYVPETTSTALSDVTTSLSGKVSSSEGLTDAEKQYYSGQALSSAADQAAGAQKSLNEQLARTGVGANTGAATEAAADVDAAKVTAGAAGLNKVTGYDIAQKNTNVQNLLSAIGIPSTPVKIGGTTQTTYEPNSGS